MLISKTHFTARSYLRIPQYEIYSTRHPDGTAHGGTAVIIRSASKHHVCRNFQTEYLQATNVSIDDWLGPITISAVYSTPRHSIKEEQYSAFFKIRGDRFLAGGDYNAKHQRWGSRLTTPKGRQLVKSMDINNLNHLSTGEPTYWPTDPNKIPNVLDLCVTKGLPMGQVTAEQNLYLSSDHSPVMITLSSKITHKSKQLLLTNKSTNWKLFKELLEERTILMYLCRTQII